MFSQYYTRNGASFRLRVVGISPPACARSDSRTIASLAHHEQEHNFATSSASASTEFRSRERCNGYTGEGETFPTGVCLGLKQPTLGPKSSTDAEREVEPSPTVFLRRFKNFRARVGLNKRLIHDHNAGRLEIDRVLFRGQAAVEMSQPFDPNLCIHQCTNQGVRVPATPTS